MREHKRTGQFAHYWQNPEAWQRRDVAVYDCIAWGWTKTDVAKFLGTKREWVDAWCLKAESYGMVRRWELRIAAARDALAQ